MKKIFIHSFVKFRIELVRNFGMTSCANTIEWTKDMTHALLQTLENFLVGQHIGNLKNYDYKAITQELNESLAALMQLGPFPK